MKKYTTWIGGLLSFFLVCVLASAFSRSSETLADYAAREPQAAYAESEAMDETVATENKNIPVQTKAKNEAKAAQAEEEGETEMKKTMSDHPDSRITYQPDFYYEPLSEDIKKRITNLSYKEDCPIPYDDLRYVSVLYVNFKGNTSTGEIICNQAIAQDLVEIFYQLYQADYQIEQLRLVDEYGADDELSMQDNNSSCFNYRKIAGTDKISMHGQGLAIDINPFFNPYVTYRENAIQVSPAGAESYVDRDKPFAYKIDENDLCYKLFTEHGFTWGGHWNSCKDYQHFEKK